MEVLSTAVCIVGAGPGGATTALQLSRLGISCIIVDRAVFPRDKVCGDGLSGKVITAMEKIDPAIAARFRAFPFKQQSWGVNFVSPGRYSMHIPYKTNYDKEKDLPNGFVCKRIHFDNFLADELKSSPLIRFYEGVNIHSFIRNADGYTITDVDKKIAISCRLLIIANGAQSTFLRNHSIESRAEARNKHASAGVRGYFRNVQGLHDDHYIELHFLKNLLPGYLWIFPTGPQTANVGLDMLQHDVSTRKINLRTLLTTILNTDPEISGRFKAAVQEGNITGYSLPLAGGNMNISGPNYLLVGDAASMIDPLTGEGIGNAMYAGRLAALAAEKSIALNDYGADQLSEYNHEVKRVLGGEFKLSYRLQRLATYPGLFNWLIKRAGNSPKIQNLISQMLYDVRLRKQLANPAFYMKLFRS